MRFPSREEVQRIRERYPVGATVELVLMNDPYNRSLVPGCRGRITAVDDIGTVHVAWRNGSTLGVVIGPDEIKIVPEDDSHDQ